MLIDNKPRIKGKRFTISTPKKAKPPMERPPLPRSPTKNLEYNGLLAMYKAKGIDDRPECDECGANLTGKVVHDRAAWLCATCTREHDATPKTPVEELVCNG